jgi:hypothetical protein
MQKRDLTTADVNTASFGALVQALPIGTYSMPVQANMAIPIANWTDYIPLVTTAWNRTIIELVGSGVVHKAVTATSGNRKWVRIWNMSSQTWTTAWDEVATKNSAIETSASFTIAGTGGKTCRKRNGVVIMPYNYGINITYAAGAVIGTVPDGFRPSVQTSGLCIATLNSNGAFSGVIEIMVATNGNITLANAVSGINLASPQMTWFTA